MSSDAKTRAAARIAACSGDAVTAICILERQLHEARAAALEEAAQVAERCCRCELYWATYKRQDPACYAHGIADAILKLKEVGYG